jgi:hypothetical protein
MEITLTGSLPPAVREVSASKHPLINFHLLEDSFVTSGMGDFLSFSGNRWSLSRGFIDLDEHAAAESGYLQAARQWLSLLQVDHPEVVEAWRELYTSLFFGSHTHTETFETRREYDILARQNCTPRGKYPPSVEYGALWTAAKAAISARSTAATSNATASLQAQLSSLQQSIASSSPACQPACFSAVPPPISPPGTLPHLVPPVAPAQAFGVGSTSSPQGPSDAGKAQIFCIICGSYDHNARYCLARIQRRVNRPTIVQRRGDVFVMIDPDGNDMAFCWRFNNPRGCPSQGCRFRHICSLCGTDGHSAANCSS